MTLELPTGSPAPHDLATMLPWRDVDLGNRVMPSRAQPIRRPAHAVVSDASQLC
jgi:hypothetical protein